MTVANFSANNISTIPRQCHPAAIAQMVMDSLRCLLGDAMQSERGRRSCLLVTVQSVLLLKGQINWPTGGCRGQVPLYQCCDDTQFFNHN